MRIVIAEDSGLLRQMLAEVLASRGFEVIGQAATLAELLRLVDTSPVDVVILDIRMPPTHRDEGLQAAERIHADHPSVALLVLSHYGETSYAVRLLKCANRAVGYLVKDRVQDADRLVEAIRRVAAGEIVIDSEVIQRVMGRPRVADPLSRLSDGEREVLALMAEGRSNAGIASKLGYAEKTVEKRVTAIGHKLDLPHMDDPGRGEINLRVLAVITFLRSIEPT